MNSVIVCGGCGKMASLIASRIYQDKNLRLSGIIEAPGCPSLGKDWGKVMGMEEINVKVESDLDSVIDQCDTVVDFTNPQATIEHLGVCSRHKKAMIIGTTGFSDDQVRQIEHASGDIPIVLSPNMALGVNLLFELVKKVSAILDDEYDIEIIETHHRYKKDAPSGTAKKIAEVIAQQKGIKLENVATYGRVGDVGQRKKSEIGIHAIRAGNINGEHTILFNSLGESLELTHRAYSREAFAQGTLRAIHFISNQQKGLFSMKEILKL